MVNSITVRPAIQGRKASIDYFYKPFITHYISKSIIPFEKCVTLITLGQVDSGAVEHVADKALE